MKNEESNTTTDQKWRSRPNKARIRLIIETIAIALIIITPFIFMLHGYLSRDPEATLNIFGYVMDKNGFPNIRTYIWFLLSKIIPLYLLSIWFFSSKQWWYHTILIPMLMYAFQTFEVIFSTDDTVDTKNILWLLPVCMVVIPFVYFIRIKLYDRYVNGIDLEAMEAELASLKRKNRLNALKNDLEQSAQNQEYSSFFDWLDHKLSTRNLEITFRQFQNYLRERFGVSI